MRLTPSSKPERSALPAGALLALVLLTALNLFNYLDRYILPGVQPLIQREFQVNDEKIGALTSAFLITYMLAAPLTGWMGDRYRRKPLIIIGALLWCLLTLLTGWVHTYRELYVRHALVGIGEASFGIFAPALLSDYFPPAARNRILSWFYMATPVGAALGYLAGGSLGPRFGWRAPFYIAAVPGALLALSMIFFLREPQRGAAEHPHPKPADPFRVRFVELLRNPAYWTATLGMAMLTFSIGGISVWMPTFLNRTAGYSLGKANLVMGATIVVDGILGTIAGGWIAQRWLERNKAGLYLLSAWSLLLGIPFALLSFYGPGSWKIVGISIAVFFLFLNTGPLNAAIVNSVGASIRATAIAVELFAIHALGDAISPRLIGFVSDRSTLSNGLAITLFSLLAGGVLLFMGARYAPSLSAARAHVVAAH